MTPIVVAGLVPLRDRSRLMSIIFTFYSIAFSIGPVVGGALVDHSSWRWIFYLNLPVTGVSLFLLFFFLHVPYNANFDSTMLQRVNITGNALLIASIVSVLIALGWVRVSMVFLQSYRASSLWSSGNCWFPRPGVHNVDTRAHNDVQNILQPNFTAYLWACLHSIDAHALELILSSRLFSSWPRSDSDSIRRRCLAQRLYRYAIRHGCRRRTFRPQ